jgi:hypothetical protein
MLLATALVEPARAPARGGDGWVAPQCAPPPMTAAATMKTAAARPGTPGEYSKCASSDVTEQHCRVAIPAVGF